MVFASNPAKDMQVVTSCNGAESVNPFTKVHRTWGLPQVWFCAEIDFGNQVVLVRAFGIQS
jgi:hypothetical protein